MKKFYRYLQVVVSAICLFSLISCEEEFGTDFTVKAFEKEVGLNTASFTVVSNYTDNATYRMGAFVSIEGTPSAENNLQDLYRAVDITEKSQVVEVFDISRASINQTYYVRPYIYLNSKKEYIYGDTQTLTTKDVSTGNAINMGQSVKWARCNLGANTPGAFGNYYAFGETSPKDTYTRENYLYNDGALANMNISGTGYDAAKVTLGGNWRMPTENDFKELIMGSDCYNAWYQQIPGTLFVSKTTGKSLFIPDAGYGENPSQRLNYTGTCIWVGEGKIMECAFSASEAIIRTVYNVSWGSGAAIRPVSK